MAFGGNPDKSTFSDLDSSDEEELVILLSAAASSWWFTAAAGYLEAERKPRSCYVRQKSPAANDLQMSAFRQFQQMLNKNKQPTATLAATGDKLVAALEGLANGQKSSDPNRKFAEYLASELTNLPAHEQSTCKKELMEVIMKYSQENESDDDYDN